MYKELASPHSTPEREAFRQNVRRFVEQEVTPFVDEWDEAETFPRDLYRKTGELDLFGNGIDEQYGGLGFYDAFMASALSEEFAKSGSGGLQASLFSCYISQGLIHKLGCETVKARTLPLIMKGEKIAALAVTEPSGGSDVAQLETKAVRDGDDWVINGSKTFITSGMRADYCVVAARTGGEGMRGISLFLVEKDMPGFTQTELRKQGWWCSDTASLYFQDVRVPAENMLGEENHGFIEAMNNFNLERLSMAANAVGSCKLLRDEAWQYAAQRETFKKALVEHQVIRHKLVEMTARTNCVEAYLDQICWRVNEGEMPAGDIAMLKVQATTVLEFCAREASQILGGASYLRGNAVERIYREVRVMAIGGGSEEVMRDLAARQMRM